MTEYDFSPDAYERFLHTQNRVANWVQHTEQHRPVFEAAVPGAPGVTPTPRRRSPPPERYLSPHRPSPHIYRRGPGSSSSDDSYVHVSSPQMHRARPPPPPIYAPPPPPGFAPFPVQPHPSPVPSRHEHYHSLSSRHRQHRSQSQSYSRRPPPPPLVTPIYTSPPASPYYPSPGYIYMSPPIYPTHPTTRPVINHYGRNSIDQTLSPHSRKAHYQLEKPPALSSASESSSSESSSSDGSTSSLTSPASLPYPHTPVTPGTTAGTRVLNSHFGGSYAPLPPPPLMQQDQNHIHSSTRIPPISGFSRGLQQSPQSHSPQGQNLYHTSHPSFHFQRNHASGSHPQTTSPLLDDQNEHYGYDYNHNYETRQPNGKRDYNPARPNTSDITICVPKPRYGYTPVNSTPNTSNPNQFGIPDAEPRYGTRNGYMTQKTPIPASKPSRLYSISRMLSPKTARASVRA